MSDNRTFLWKHGSVLFVGAQLIVSAVLITLSIALHGKEPYAGVISHLAAMFVAALIATVFFGLRDVRESLAGSVSTLLLDGEVVTHLTEKARHILAQKILLEDVQQASELPSTLYRHTNKVQRRVFATPHLFNYTPTVILSEIPDEPELLRRDYRCTYSVNTSHLRGGRGIYALRFRHEVLDPTGDVSKKKLLTAFEARIGDQVFTIDDISEHTQRHSGGLTTTVLSMKRDVEVVGEVPVTIAYDGIASRRDPTEILYAIYPTKGYRVTLLHREDAVYDAAWFKPWTDATDDFPWREQVILMQNGITTYTDGWLMPGHGVVLYWFPRSSSPIPNAS